MVIPAALLVVEAHIGCDRIWAVTVISLATGMLGASAAGFMPNYMDIAPRFSGWQCIINFLKYRHS